MVRRRVSKRERAAVRFEEPVKVMVSLYSFQKVEFISASPPAAVSFTFKKDVCPVLKYTAFRTGRLFIWEKPLAKRAQRRMIEDCPAEPCH